MSRENFLMPLNRIESKEEKGGVVYVMIHNIESVTPTDKGTIVRLASGMQYVVAEPPAEIDRKAKQYGILRILD